MSNSTKFKSLDAIKRAIREGRKFASALEEDPNEVAVPETDKENVVDASDMNIPTDGVKNTDNLEEGRIDNTPLDNTLTAEDPEIEVKKEPEVKKEEKDVTIKGAGVAKKLANLLNKKTEKKASNDNIAANISLDKDTLSKIANVMLKTEAGRRCAVQALEQNKAEQMKVATLRELIAANEQYESQKQAKKVASVKYAQEAAIAAHNDTLNRYIKDVNIPELNEAIKLAYAQGAQDAEAVNQMQGEVPAPEAATPAQQQNEAMEVISMLLQAGQINEQQAEQLAQLASQVAMQDQNPELSPEEFAMALQMAVEQGLIDPAVVEQLLGAAPAPEAGTAPAASVAPEAAAPAGADPAGAEIPAEEAAKTAAIRKVAANTIAATHMLKKAAAEEGAVDTDEVTLDDVDAVIDTAVETGELSAEDAVAIKAEIANELVAAGEGTGEDAVIAEGGEDDIVAAIEEIDQVIDTAVESGEIDVTQANELKEEIADEILGGAADGQEEVAAIEGADEEISPDELAEILAAQGVTEEELAEALGEGGDKEVVAEGVEAEGGDDEDEKEDEE